MTPTARRQALQADGKILVGGNFLSFDGTARPGIARLNPNGNLDTSFVPMNPNTAELVGTQGVGALAVQPGGKIVVGPALTGTPTSPFRLFRLDADGSVDQTFPLRSGLGCDSCVIHSITLQTGGAIVIAGEFDIVDGAPRLALARLMPDGAAPVQTATPTRPTPTAPSCTGDCNGDRTVAINELITCVNIALGNTQVAICQPCDDDGDGAVKINEADRCRQPRAQRMPGP